MTTIDDRLHHIIRELISSGITLEQALDVFEGKYIAAAMDENEGNVTRASRLLGVHRNTLHNKLREKMAVNGYVATIRRKKRGKTRASRKKTTRSRK